MSRTKNISDNIVTWDNNISSVFYIVADAAFAISSIVIPLGVHLQRYQKTDIESMEEWNEVNPLLETILLLC